MGRKLNYKVETKVQRLPKDLQKLFKEISTAYGNSENKDAFIAKYKSMLSQSGINPIGRKQEPCAKLRQPSHYINPACFLFAVVCCS